MADTYKKWESRIEKERRAHEKCRDAAKKAAKAARDDDDLKQNFNIFWANCKITRSAIYGNRPKPDVRRRFQKPDPEEKELARMVERAIDYNIDTTDFDAAANMAVKDYVEAGLGTVRVFLDVKTQPVMGPMGEPLLDEEGEPAEEIVSQSVGLEHIPWRYFHWEPGKSWDNVNWIAISSFRPQKEVEREYGVEIKSGKDDDDKRASEEYADEVQLYEIYDKPSRKVIVIAAGHPEVLEERDDKLNLAGFFPVPRPLFANLKSDELLPKPDYAFIEQQIIELNRITKRIKSLADQIKANGFFDSSIQGLGKLMDAADGTLLPVSNLQGATEGSPQTAITYLPFGEKIIALQNLMEQREKVKGEIYEITGLSDIVRGNTHASETAAAQNLKGQWANVRLSEKSGEVARHFREVFRMMAEIICEHFQPQMLTLQTGVEVTPRMMQIMQSDIGRSYAIDVETDSTIQKDDYEERQQTMEMINIILEKLQQVVPAVQQGLLPVTFVQETLLMIVNKHKGGKQLEDAIQELGPHWQQMQQFQQQLQQMQQAIQQRDMQLQQAGQQLQGLQQQLGKFNERKEAREDAKVQSEIRSKQADIADDEFDNRVDGAKAKADVELKAAQTAKTWREAREPRDPMGMVQ